MVASRINRSGQQKESFAVANTQEAIAACLDELNRRHKRLLVACESTSDYHRTLALTCLERNIPLRLLNPLTTKQFIRATVRKRKTDLSDALIVAKLALQGEGRIVTAADFSVAKVLSRTAAKLIGFDRALQLMIRRLDTVAPEAVPILEACRSQMVIGAKVLRKQVHAQLDHDTQKLLTSIPGVGPIIADVLITEIGDIRRFRSAKALAAYAGLDPKVKQSGSVLKRNTKLTKRGSPHLRHSAFFAASMALRHRDPEFSAYYNKKRAEGKAYAEATSANARKLLYRVYAVWKRGTPYIPLPSK